MTSLPPPPPTCETSPATPSDNGALASNGATPANWKHAVTPSLTGQPSPGPFRTSVPECGSCTAGTTTSSTYAPAAGNPLSSPYCTSVWTCLLASRDDWPHDPPEPRVVGPWRCSSESGCRCSCPVSTSVRQDIDGATGNSHNFRAGIRHSAPIDRRSPGTITVADAKGGWYERIHKLLSAPRCLWPESFHLNVHFWMIANILVLFTVRRDGDPITGNAYILGIHCTERLRSSMCVDATSVSLILRDRRSSLL